MIRTALKMTLLTVTLAAGATAAQADKLDTVLKGLNGNFRGTGSIKLPDRPGSDRVTCQIAGAQASSSVAVTGRCATAQRVVPITGRLARSGESINGTMLSAPGLRVDSSSGRMAGETLVINSNLTADDGKRVLAQQRVNVAGNGFTVSFAYTEPGGKNLKPAGSIRFVRR